MLKKTALLLLVVNIIICLASCGTNLKEEIVGVWQIVEESKYISRGVYPEISIMVFYDDGTWGERIGEHKNSNTYIVADDTIIIDARWLVHQYTFSISIENDVLKLQYPGYEPLYYKRLA